MTTVAGTWIRGALCVALLTSTAPLARAQAPASSRVALVIGEGAYARGALPAAPNDAGLVAQVLAGAGFDVTGARDLDGDGLRHAFRDFLDQAGAAGPDGIAVVYFAGRALQADGENYVVPVDARLARTADVPVEALRLADLTHALAALPIQARVVVVDGAYAGGSSAGGEPASGAAGLALMEAEQGELLAFNAAPGTVAKPGSAPYGVYAQALVAAVKQGGVPVDEVFDRVRLAVDQVTGGAVVPWDSDKLTRSFSFFDRAAGAPAAASAQVPFSAMEKRPLRDFPAEEAYDVALARDTLPSYAEFLAGFPNSPLARRVRLIVAVRREALFWRAALQGNVPGAYWTYLARYPKGPHAGDARRRLARLSAAALPPDRFVPMGFDVPPPAPGDLVYGLPYAFDAPDLPPPPPPPIYLLPPPVVVVLERPARPPGPRLLPVPVPVAIPFVRAPVEPGSIAPPRGVRGEYERPRPFVRGPDGDGVVVGAPPSGSRPPAASLPAPPVPQAGSSRTGSGVAAPARGMPAPAATLPVPPVAPLLHAPRIPDVPAPRSVTAPAVSAPTPPLAPSAPAATAAPASAATSAPPSSERHPGHKAPRAPAAERVIPDDGTRRLPAPGRPAPLPSSAGTPAADAAGAAHRPQRTTTAPASPPPAAPMPHPPATAPSQFHIPPAEAAPAAHPAAPQRPQPRSAAPERPAPLPQPPAPAQPPPRSASPDHAGPGPGAGQAPGGRHPACGHPGEPPCRP